ncbi:MAG: leucine--tRNA ligase [Bdellovibrionales bacterium]|nr:leucine--tRNA ligase [Bdellovibrionales bacterium]
MKEYNPREVERKWQKFWDDRKTFKVDRPGPKKLYCLDMFPYPSGSGLHVGHPLGYTATDIFCRFKRMHGYSVLHPMGFDAFGLPAEQHAVSTGEHPAIITKQNCETFTSQLKLVGLSYDWDRMLATCEPEYYHWTQWIFIQIFNSWFDAKEQRARPIEELPIPGDVSAQGEVAVSHYRDQHRLAYYADAMVNWCPALGTVLANEEVIDGKSERGGYDVIRKPMKQWLLRITDYAERLLKDLDEIEWPESIKDQQRNWIGKKQGAEILFQVEDSNLSFWAFTTRPDTLFGVTYFVISPEHPAVEQVTMPEQRSAVQKYCASAKAMSELNRTIENRKKTGVFTGSYVINPINGARVPLYVGDYVLMTFGTGAVMGVPAHDERDFEFARTFQIDIVPVIVPLNADSELEQAIREGEIPFTDEGVMLRLDEEPKFVELGLEGRPNEEVKWIITGWLEEQGLGRGTINYKLRDWLFSRQRYWGEPIPVVHWDDGTMSAIDASELPLVLPQVQDYKPAETGESPLAKAEDWLKVESSDGRSGRRETNTMPQWAGSCWYYLRFIDPRNSEEGWNRELEKAWMPVDLYVGGAEHAVLHLLYARFWHKILFDLGHVSTNEPFQRLFNQGMLQAFAFKNKRGALVPVDQVEEVDGYPPKHLESGEELTKIIAKMSKSLRNVVTLDDIVESFGADTFRVYLMFMGPLDTSRVWDSQAISGSNRFLKRAWNFVIGESESGVRPVVLFEEESAQIKTLLHQTIQKVTEDIGNLSFNTAIAAMMEFLNGVGQHPVSKQTLESFVLILSPFAPHLGEELWSRLGHADSLACANWPEVIPEYLKQEIINVVVQVNGKKRAVLEVSCDISEEDLKAAIVDKMRGSDYEVEAKHRFITVFKPGTSQPKLVNVLTA